MPVTLKDGHGTGNLAMVDSEGHLAVGAIQKSALQHQSETYENVYAFSNATYNYTAADTILLAKNTHASKAMRHLDRGDRSHASSGSHPDRDCGDRRQPYQPDRTGCSCYGYWRRDE